MVQAAIQRKPSEFLHGSGPIVRAVRIHEERRSEVPVRLLVVEDEPKMAKLLEAALQREGHAVDRVDNGSDAVWMATECDYDAIVLDVMIPPPNGFEVCRALRDRGRWAPIL